MRARVAAAGILAALLLAPSAQAQAQRASQPEPIPTVTGTLAIRGAHVVRSAGLKPFIGTVVIRDGLITAVGPDVAIPYDARIIDADSMWLYPGFVDVLSYAAVPEPERQQNLPSIENPDDPPPDRAGIQPDRDVRGLLKMDDASATKLRDTGFTSVHAVPRGGMLAGKGAVVLLSSDVRRAVIRAGISQAGSFETGRGVYPGTPMAVSAKLRQLVRESMRRTAVETRYESDPSGMVPPPWDAVHEAVAPMASGDTPIYFHVQDALEAHRALALRDELGLRMVLTGLNEGFELTDRLARSGVPLAVTVDLPAKPEWASQLKADSLETVMDSFEPADRMATYRDQEAELRNLRARQLVSRREYVTNARRLSEAGLRYGIATRDAKPADVRKNLLEMVSAGLDPDAALAALTVNGAEVLGISSSVGSVDPGKLGNVVVSSGPYFDEKSSVKYVVVAGEVFEPAATPAARGRGARGDSSSSEDSPSGPAGSEFAGTWSLNAYTPDGVVGGRLVLEAGPGGITGELTYDNAPSAIRIPKTTVDGDTISFEFSSPDGYVRMRLTRDENTINGVADVEGVGPLTVDGRRRPG